jgi:glycerol-3-phosphate dehydrogenase
VIDVIIIGGGVIGCLVGRELARSRLDLLLVDRAGDLADATTKANSAIVHAGFDALPGTRKAALNVAGNRMFDQLCADLDVPFRRTGSLVLAFTGAELPTLDVLEERGRRNGVPGLARLDGDAVRRLEPNLAPVAGALAAATGAIVGPWELALAAAENAMDNGMAVRLEHEVTAIARIPGGFRVTAGGEAFEARAVVNCAGLCADRVHDLVAEPAFRIQYGRGEYFVLDRSEGGFVRQVIFQCPTAAGKGVLIAPTVHGNLLVGPNAVTVDDPGRLGTTLDGLDQVRRAALRSAPGLPLHRAITTFAGLRATPDGHDFIIGPAAGAPGFFDAAGIDSPGLSSAPAIAVQVAALVREHLGPVAPRADFRPRRRPQVRFAGLDRDRQAALVRQDPSYGRVVCRCERITEGEILDAIRRRAGATTLDGVKRRVRPGMGRCQGGFCGPRVVEILARELGVPVTGVRKDGPGSYLLAGATKQAGGRD